MGPGSYSNTWTDFCGAIIYVETDTLLSLGTGGTGCWWHKPWASLRRRPRGGLNLSEDRMEDGVGEMGEQKERRETGKIN